MDIKEEIKQKVIDGDIAGTTESVKKAVESEMPAPKFFWRRWFPESRKWDGCLRRRNIS